VPEPKDRSELVSWDLRYRHIETSSKSWSPRHPMVPALAWVGPDPLGDEETEETSDAA